MVRKEKGAKMFDTEYVANRLVDSTSGVKLYEASFHAGTEEYEKASRAIVEPEMDARYQDYADFIEDDTENWVSFIRNNLGSEWAKIAEIVKEDGY
jgi:hypothetical protein